MRRSNRSRVDVSRFAAVAGSSLSLQMAPPSTSRPYEQRLPPCPLAPIETARPGGVLVSMHLDTAMTARHTEWRTAPFA